MHNQKLQTQDRLAFIESLEIPSREEIEALPGGGDIPPDPAGTVDGVPTADPDKPSGFVNQGSLVSFVTGLNPQNQADVLNSTLLAQLAATKKHDRQKKTADWYAFYHMVLENLGWVVQGFQFQEYHASGSKATVEAAVADVLAAAASGAQLAVIEQTIAAAKALAKNKDGRLVIFESNSQDGPVGNVQIGACAESGDLVAFSIGAFSFEASHTDSSFLFLDFSSADVKILQAAQVMTLNREIYSGNRAAVVDKLAGNAKKLIASLDI